MRLSDEIELNIRRSFQPALRRRDNPISVAMDARSDDPEYWFIHVDGGSQEERDAIIAAARGFAAGWSARAAAALGGLNEDQSTVIEEAGMRVTSSYQGVKENAGASLSQETGTRSHSTASSP